MTGLIFIECIHSFDMHSLIYSLPHSALTRFSWLPINTIQAVLSQTKGILWLLYLDSPRVQLASHTGGLYDVPQYVLLLCSFFFSPHFPFSFLLPPLFPHFSQALSFWQVKETSAASNKHPSTLATQGREDVYCC